MFSMPLNVLGKTGRYEAEFKIPAQDLGLSLVFSGQKVGLALRLEQVDTSILARGSIAATAHLSCSRCLEEFDLPLKADFTFQFLPSLETKDDVDAADAGDGCIAFQGEEIPLGEQLRQELELGLPFRPICKEDCQGLCEGCGADLNQEPCSCGEKKTSGPFSGLGDLIKNSETKGRKPPIN